MSQNAAGSDKHFHTDFHFFVDVIQKFHPSLKTKEDKIVRIVRYIRMVKVKYELWIQ